MNVEGEEGESKVLVIEHGEEEAGGGMGAVERTHPTPHTHLTTHTHGRTGRMCTHYPLPPKNSFTRPD